MKLVLFDDAKTGLLRDGRVVDLSPVLGSLAEKPAQWLMEAVIEAFDEYRPQFEQLAESEQGVPCDSVQIQAPLPRPRHLLCAFSNYLEREGAQRGIIDFFYKGATSIVGTGTTIEVPDLKIGKQARHVSEEDAMDHVCLAGVCRGGAPPFSTRGSTTGHRWALHSSPKTRSPTRRTYGCGCG